MTKTFKPFNNAKKEKKKKENYQYVLNMGR